MKSIEDKDISIDLPVVSRAAATDAWTENSSEAEFYLAYFRRLGLASIRILAS